jgi:hypothetical protein
VTTQGMDASAGTRMGAIAGTRRDDGQLFVRDLHETKPFAKTSEFWVWLVTVAIVVAWSMRDGGDSFTSDEGMTLAAGLSAAYLVSRGLAKAGSREPSIDRLDS